MKSQLTKEQSQHLIELGFPKWRVQEIKPSDVSLKDWTPTITLTDLLEILPKEIEYKEEEFSFMCPIDITYGSDTSEDSNVWFASYDDYGGTGFEFQFCQKELIDALYELCVWMIENKYL